MSFFFLFLYAEEASLVDRRFFSEGFRLLPTLIILDSLVFCSINTIHMMQNLKSK